MPEFAPSASSHGNRSRSLSATLSGLLLTCGLLLSASSLQGQLTYDADTGTTGAQDGVGLGWNTSATNWWSSGGNVLWPNTGDSTSVAIFGAGPGSGAAGTVTVGTVTANGITFNAPGSGTYTLTGGTITLAGTAPTITTNVAAQIDSVITGTAGFAKNGSGTLTLNGINTYSGTTYLNAGSTIARLNITGTTTESALSTSAVRIATGASLTLKNGNTLNLTPAPGNAMSGSGELVIEFAAGGTARNTTPPSTFLSNFTGTIRLATSTGAATSDKLNVSTGITTAASLTVVNGTQLFVNGATATFFGGITVSGTGNGENRGAFRVNSTLNSQVTLAGNTTLAFEGGTLNGTLSNTATSVLTVAGAGNGSGTFGASLQNGVGTTSLIQSTTGTVTLGGTTHNTYTGSTTVNAGILRLNKTAELHAIHGDGVAGTTDLILGDGTGTDTLQLAASNQIRDSVEITMGATGTPVFDLNGFSETIGSLSSTNTAASVTLGAATGTLTVQNGRTGSNSSTFAGIISGLGSLVVDAATGSTFTLSGANTYSGSTTVKSGTLVLDYDTSNTSKLSDTGALNLGTGTLALAGNTGNHIELVAGTSVTGSASIGREGSGSAQISLGSLAFGTGAFLEVQSAGLATTTTANDATGVLNRVTIGGILARNDGAGNIVAYNAFTDVSRLGGTITNNANAHLRIVESGGSGNVTLASSGTTNISTLSNAAAGGLTTVNIGAGNTLRLGTMGTITNASDSAGLTIATGTLTAGGTDNNGGELIFANYTPYTTTVSSTIANNGSGSVTVTKVGSGELVLSSANTYNGITTVTGGTLKVAHVSALGTGGLTLRGGRLQLATDTAVNSKNLTLEGDATVDLDRATSGAAIATTFGTLTSTSGDRTLTVTRGANASSGTATLTFNNTLSLNQRTTTFDIGANAAVALTGTTAVGAQTISIIKNGAGTLILGANNGSNMGTWDGGAATQLNEGTLDLRTIMGDSGVFRNLVAMGGTTLRLTRDADYDFRSGVIVAGNMRMVVDRVNAAATSTTHTLGTLSIGGSTLTVSKGDNVTGSTTGGLNFAGAVTFTGDSDFNPETNAELTLSGVISGGFSLSKSGSGQLTLANTTANTYAGRTLIKAGLLRLTSTGTTGTGAVTVQSGAQLLGTGRVIGNSFTAESGASIHAGDTTATSSLGTLTFAPVSGGGDFNFQAGSTVFLGLESGGASDKLVFTGTGSNNLTFASNVVVGPATLAPTTATVFDLMDWSGLLNSPTFASHFSSNLIRDGAGDNGSAWDLPDVSGTGYHWDLSQFVVNGSIALVAVPEPGRVMLVTLALAAGMLRRRRR